MAGNTGKMTREAIAARGPRLFLLRHIQTHVWSIAGENEQLPEPNSMYAVYARSYSRSYLERVKRGMEIQP